MVAHNDFYVLSTEKGLKDWKLVNRKFNPCNFLYGWNNQGQQLDSQNVFWDNERLHPFDVDGYRLAWNTRCSQIPPRHFVLQQIHAECHIDSVVIFLGPKMVQWGLWKKWSTKPSLLGMMGRSTFGDTETWWFCVPQIHQFCLLTKLFRAKFASSKNQLFPHGFLQDAAAAT